MRNFFSVIFVASCVLPCILCGMEDSKESSIEISCKQTIKDIGLIGFIEYGPKNNAPKLYVHTIDDKSIPYIHGYERRVYQKYDTTLWELSELTHGNLQVSRVFGVISYDGDELALSNKDGCYALYTIYKKRAADGSRNAALLSWKDRAPEIGKLMARMYIPPDARRDPQAYDEWEIEERMTVQNIKNPADKKVIECKEWDPFQTLDQEPGKIRDVVFSLYGNYLIYAADNNIVVNNRDEKGFWRSLMSIEGDTQKVYQLAISYPAVELASGGAGNQVKIWDLSKLFACDEQLHEQKKLDTERIENLKAYKKLLIVNG